MTISWRIKETTYALIFCAVMTVPALALDPVEYQSIRSIVELAESTVLQSAENLGIERAQVQVSQPDNRLRLPLCLDGLSARSSQPNRILGRSSVEVSCAQPNPWRIYVQATTTATLPYPVLISSLERGHRISEQDLEVRYINLSQELNGVVDNIDLIVGKVTNRYMASGEPIRASHLSAPVLVRRGQQIQLRYQLGQLEVSMAGISQSDGISGQWIKVENTKSGALVDGQVNADGSITVPSR